MNAVIGHVLSTAPTLFPVPGNLFTNGLLVGIIANLHVQLATFITGSTTLIVIGEAIALVRPDARQDRFTAGQIKAMTYLFGFGSATAILFIIVVLSGVWGRFWVGLQQIQFWTLTFEAATFVGEVVLTYVLYANWERLLPYRRARFALCILLAVDTWWQMFFIDVVASFMLSPNGGDQNQLRNLLNPTEIDLTLHRTVGNIAWAGAVIAAYAAVRYLWEARRESAGARTPEPARVAPARSVGAMSAASFANEVPVTHGEAVGAGYYDWLGQWGATWAVGMTLLQPWIGYSYAKDIQLHNYTAWFSMMYGTLSNLFLTQIVLLGSIFVLGTLFFRSRLRASGGRSRTLDISLGVVVFATLLAAVPYHLSLACTGETAVQSGGNPCGSATTFFLGQFIPFKVIALVLMMLGGLFGLTSFLNARARDAVIPGQARRGSQRLLLALALNVSVMMIVMGVIREHSRQPDLVYCELRIQGQQPEGAVQSGTSQPCPTSMVVQP